MKFLLIIPFFLAGPSLMASEKEPAYANLRDGSDQYASFPRPLEMYPAPGESMADTLITRAAMDPFNVAATLIFLCAIIHTFAAGYFNKLAHRYERPADHPEVSFRATLFHFLGEVEAIFGIWVIALAAAAVWFHSWADFKLYIGVDRVFTEPLFVVVIMAIAASRPVLRFSENVMSRAASLGKGSAAAWWLSVLIIAPILGSFITEPAAMTIGALLLAKRFYRHSPPAKLAYATLGLLFVNISIGGTLTHFAAPPVLMVAGKWNWDTLFMLQHFGWKALVAIVISNAAYFLWFRKQFSKLTPINANATDEIDKPIPAWVTAVHLGFLGWTVYSAHFPALFIGGFLFFLAFITATRHHQTSVSMRSPLLVGFFLAGLVIHGGCQSWWISPVITALPDQLLMLGSTILTAFNDNAAITYLAAQVDGLGAGAKHAIVAGAVTGGGLTVIANAPNPAGQSILSPFFKNGISPLRLFLSALVPTLIAYLCFVFLPG